ncbi:MAG: linear amide C-N hydrolase [Chthoniobacterales bacterium]|nr:linear amide C-N hydrolase [Chthoniobacterales bacterium]
MKPKILITTFAGLLLCSLQNSHACSRITYVGPDKMVAMGRTMDWFEDIKTDLWLFPAGIKRCGNDHDPKSLTWTSKYGNLIASGYNIGTTDGINSEGLCANVLYLSTANYGAQKPDRKNLSILIWAQYFLDNYATVDEAVKDFSKDFVNIIANRLPNGSQATVHLAIADRSGDNAIFEYVDGKLIVHHNKKYDVMTNEPTYEKQLALNDYWQELKGTFLPGTDNPSDRFVRASYFLNNAKKTSNPEEAIAVVFSIMRNVSTPMMAETDPAHPNIAATVWRSAADLKNNLYFFENSERPNVFWVDLNKCNLKKGASIKKLPLQQGQVYAGEVSDKFIPTTSFFSQDK